MSKPSESSLSADQLRAVKARIISCLTNEDIFAISALLVPPPTVVESAVPDLTDYEAQMAVDKECGLCLETIGETRPDGSIGVGVSLPCNRSFGMHCLAQASQYRVTCPMCCVNIPPGIIADLILFIRAKQLAEPVHPGCNCEHNAHAFKDRSSTVRPMILKATIQAMTAVLAGSISNTSTHRRMVQ
jgi:hypothetical protein